MYSKNEPNRRPEKTMNCTKLHSHRALKTPTKMNYKNLMKTQHEKMDDVVQYFMVWTAQNTEEMDILKIHRIQSQPMPSRRACHQHQNDRLSHKQRVSTPTLRAPTAASSVTNVPRGVGSNHERPHKLSLTPKEKVCRPRPARKYSAWAC